MVTVLIRIVMVLTLLVRLIQTILTMMETVIRKIKMTAMTTTLQSIPEQQKSAVTVSTMIVMAKIKIVQAASIASLIAFSTGTLSHADAASNPSVVVFSNIYLTDFMSINGPP